MKNQVIQNGSFMSHPATNKKALWNGTGIYRIADGKIVEDTFSEDILDVYMQLVLLNK